MSPQVARELRESATLQAIMRRANVLGVPTAEEERELIRRAQDGDDDAREQMIVRNALFVAAIAGEYAGMGLPISDLISTGFLRIDDAIMRFDLDRPGKFITYAARWIRQTIRLDLSTKSRLVRIPVNRVTEFLRWRRWVVRVEAEEGRTPAPDEIAERFGVPVDIVRAVRSADSGPADVADISGSSTDSDDEVRVVDVIPSPAPLPSDRLERESTRKFLLGLCEDKLTAKERKVIGMRFGLDGSPPLRRGDIGAEFGRSAERMRQVEEIALAKLRRAIRRCGEEGVLS